MVALISEFVYPLVFQPTLLTVLVPAAAILSSHPLNISV